MPLNNPCYILFYTIHDVLKAEKQLKKRGLPHELIPVPRNLSSDCGSCIRSSVNVKDLLIALENIEIQKCYIEKGQSYEEIV